MKYCTTVYFLQIYCAIHILEPTIYVRQNILPCSTYKAILQLFTHLSLDILVSVDSCLKKCFLYWSMSEQCQMSEHKSDKSYVKMSHFKLTQNVYFQMPQQTRHFLFGGKLFCLLHFLESFCINGKKTKCWVFFRKQSNTFFFILNM